jgi:hypothetical protein
MLNIYFRIINSSKEFMKLLQENSDSETSTEELETCFLRGWPDDEPDINNLVHQTLTDDLNQDLLEEQPHVAHVYRTKETYASFISICMLPCVGKNTYRSFETGSKNFEESFTIEDEALCFLVLANSINKWQDEAVWRNDNSEYHNTSKKIQSSILKTFSKSLYTETIRAGNTTERKMSTRQGWSPKGQSIFLLFKKAIALKRDSFTHMDGYRSYVTGKLCRKGKRKQRDFSVVDPEEKKYMTFIAMAEEMNGRIG